MPTKKELEVAFGDAWHPKAREVFELLAGTVTPREEAGTTYTLVDGDAGAYIAFTNAGAVTLTVPTDAAVRYRAGTVITFEQVGAGQVTVAAAGGVTVNSAGSKLASASQFSVLSLIKRDTNTWTLCGDRA